MDYKDIHNLCDSCTKDCKDKDITMVRCPDYALMGESDYIDRLEAIRSRGIVDLDKKVYRLNAEDVVCVLSDMGLLDKFTDEELNEIVDIVDNRLEIPWTEYIEAVLEYCVPKVGELLHERRMEFIENADEE